MLNTLKLLVHRFRPKMETGRNEAARNCQDSDQAAPCNHGIGTSSIDDQIEANEIRKKAYSELHLSDVTARQRERLHMDKWFNRGELTNSGSFNIAEFQRRMEETDIVEPLIIEALPAQEDLFMAFSKPDVDLFEEEKMTLSGIFQRINLNEEVEETDRPFSTHTARRAKRKNLAPSVEDCSNLDFSLDGPSNSIADTPCLNMLRNDIYQDDLKLEETLQELIDATPAQNRMEHVESRTVSKIDPSALFEDWGDSSVFNAAPDPVASLTESTEEISFDPALIDLTIYEPPLSPNSLTDTTESAGTIDQEIASVDLSIELLNGSSEDIADWNETTLEDLPHIVIKQNVKMTSKPKDAYWDQSDRLSRFGRRRTSASCSSIRLKA
ncbi:MAG: hypothetical protein K2X93_29210 [Candidatus Obscuribacterales bacterium]|nr:hypothetical protein [Candidatus Obscuribacterales bacterium]